MMRKKDIRGFNCLDNGLLLKLSDVHNIVFYIFSLVKYSIITLHLTNITTRTMLTTYNMKWKEQEAELGMHYTPNFVRTEQIKRENLD